MIRHLSVLTVALSAAACFAQQQTNADPQLLLSAAVTTKTGSPIAGLTKEDFKVLDNGIVRPITAFRAPATTDSPSKVILVLDEVNPQYGVISVTRQQLTGALHENGGKLAHSTSISILTDTGLEASSDFSTDGTVLSDFLTAHTIRVHSITHQGDETSDMERFKVSVDAFQKAIAQAGSVPGRKVMIWISPGWPLLADNRFQITSAGRLQIFTNLAAITNTLRKAGITLYVVDEPGGPAASDYRSATAYEAFLKPVSNPSRTDFANLALPIFAIHSGGLVRTSNNNIVPVLQNFLAPLGSDYEIAFAATPSEHANEHHHIEVQIAHPDAIVRTTEGYYSSH